MSDRSSFPDPEEETHARERRERRRHEDHQRVVRQRRLAAVILAAAVALLIGLVAGIGSGGGGGGSNGSQAASKKTNRNKRTELPGGGRTIFPDRRVVAFYGAPQDEELGALGIGSPKQAGAKLLRQAKPYATKDRKTLPAFELLATVAASHPGDDGQYRTRLPDKTIRRYLKAARRDDALLLLDIQPGRANFLDEAKHLEKWLREPDVGLALDPEWRMGADQVPGDAIGQVSADEVNSVSEWLSNLVEKENLPEKLFLVHRFTEQMVQQPERLKRPKGLAMTLNVDGFGTRQEKIAKYRDLVPKRFNAGFKLFYKEDTGLMKPRQVLRLRPQPDLVVYE